MKIMKFGGTSVGKPERMHQVADLITATKDQKIVVLSAVSGTTNALVEIGNLLSRGDRSAARERIGQLEEQYKGFVEGLFSTSAGKAEGERVIAEHFEFLSIILKISYSEALNKDILAQGELLSTRLFSAFLTEKNIGHALLPALEFMVLDKNDEPDLGEIRNRLLPLLEKHKTVPIFITQGFICRNARGEVDNLKRGGSDYSASLIAAAVRAASCEIWTDISGMHNNDPRIVKQTRPVEQLSFDEAAELAYFGAKILHPASIWPAQQFKIPVKLLNTMEPEAAGTLIAEHASSRGVKAVAAKDGITAIKIKSSRMLLAYGFLRKIFEVFEKYETPIDMITTSEVAVSVTIDDDRHLDDIIRELEVFGSVEVDRKQTIISIVGEQIASDGDSLRKIFHSLNDIFIRMVSYGGSDHNVSLLVNAGDKNKALTKLNEGLFGL